MLNMDPGGYTLYNHMRHFYDGNPFVFLNETVGKQVRFGFYTVIGIDRLAYTSPPN